ncbi:PIN domain-containing protein [Candidatus Margulisiibacteriota bacterium]
MLETKNIFIDTEIFSHNKFDFNNRIFQQLKEALKKKHFNLILTDVVVNEAKKKIAETLKAQKKPIKDIYTNTHFLEARIPEIGLFHEKTKQENLFKIGLSIWEDFIKETNAKIIEANTVDCSVLLSKYFNNESPFNNKKKHEFPDAISLLALSLWAINTKSKVYVISGDQDFKGFTSNNNFIHLNSLSALLDIYNQSDEYPYSKISNLIKKEEDKILEKIGGEFSCLDFAYQGHYDAEITSIEVADIKLDEYDIVDISDENFELYLGFYIEFSADIKVPAYANGYWDSEDCRYVCGPEFETTEYFSDHYTASMTVSYDLSANRITGFNDIIVNANETIILPIKIIH